MSKRWTEEQLDILIENYGKFTNREIGSLIGKSMDAVQLKSRKIGLKSQSKYSFDRSYFEKIDTTEKSYWLGFIFADGYVIHDKKRRNYELGIELTKSDSIHLEKFNTSINGNVEVSYRTRTNCFTGKYANNSYDTCLIRFYSINIVEDLMKHGVMQNKTYTDLCLPKLNDELMWHFVRGFLDGDGHIYTQFVKGHEYVKIGFTNLSENILKELQRFLSKFHINSNIGKNKKDNDVLQLCITDQDSIVKFYSKCYNNPIIYLDRKYQLYKETIKIALR